MKTGCIFAAITLLVTNTLVLLVAFNLQPMLPRDWSVNFKGFGQLAMISSLILGVPAFIFGLILQSRREQQKPLFPKNRRPFGPPGMGRSVQPPTSKRDDTNA